MNTAMRISIPLLAGIFWVQLAAGDWQPSVAGESSCYAKVGIKEPPPLIKRGLLVLVDNTVEFDQRIRDEILRKIIAFMSEHDRPSGIAKDPKKDPKIGDGDRVIIMSFSHYGSDRFTGIRGDWRLEQLLVNTGGVPRSDLRDLRRCLARQVQYRRSYIQDRLGAIYKDSDRDIPKTELIWTLVRTSRELIPIFEVEEIFLLIVSDMMENSDITSFYMRGKAIDPNAQMRKMEKTDVIANYSGVNVYVMGAGYTEDRSHPTKVMRKVKNFWQQYIERAGGRLCELGTPLMFGNIGRCRLERCGSNGSWS